MVDKNTIKFVINSEGESNFDKFFELFFDFDTLEEDQNKNPQVVCAFKNDRWIWELDKKNNALWICSKIFWSYFRDDFNLNYWNVQAFVRFLMKEHFQRKNVRLMTKHRLLCSEVEKHFNGKDAINPSNNLKVYRF